MSAKGNAASSSSCVRGFDVSSRSPDFRRKRRALVASAATWPALIWVGAACAQAKKAPIVIDWLHFGSKDSNPRLIEIAQRTSAHFGVEPRFTEVAKGEEIEPAIAKLAKDGVQALAVMSSPLFSFERRRIIGLALAQRWPMIAGNSNYVADGALLSYGAVSTGNYRRVAYFVDRILKGAKPGDLPIEQPTTFELAVNLKTAKMLGLTMPPEIMVRAERVVE